MKRQFSCINCLVLSALFFSFSGPNLRGQNEDLPITELKEFMIEETEAADTDSLLPTDREVSSAFFADMTLIDIPRSITVISPEAMQQFQIENFSDLNKIGAGTTTINFYGIPAMPTIRGAKGGSYFNGMLRAFNRNEMPISFGSLEAMNVVKGPAPSHLEVTHVGGFVDFIPKSPYFDQQRSSLKLQVGTHEFYNAQLDTGGPALIFGKPSAYRISITGQNAGSYWDNVDNDFISLYGSIKSRVSENVILYTGAEYFNFRTNENVGWNRPTQNLIDNGEYVIGEPIDITSSLWGENANRNLIEFPHNAVLPHLNALAIPGDIARAQIPADLLGTMLNLNVQADIDEAYRTLTPDELYWQNPAWIGLAQTELDTLDKPAQDVYLYTPEYFATGGEALSEKINGSTVLASPTDYANSEDFLWFADLDFTGNPDRIFTWKNFVEILSTEKLSSYGYAINTDQTVLASKFIVTDYSLHNTIKLQYGADLRYTDAKMVQDYFAEPFSRRDITRSDISPNTVILSGPQTGPDGLNFWSPSGGANVESDLFQASLFAQAQIEFTKRFSTLFSARLEHADFDVALPAEVDRRSPTLEETVAAGSGNKTYHSVAINPIFSIAKNTNLYAAIQYGTSMNPTQGGPIFGEDNFAESELQEIGLKGSAANGSFYYSVSAYQWEQSRFNSRDARSEPLEGEGFELETTWSPTDNFTLIASYDNMTVRRNISMGYRALPQNEEDWALNGGILSAASGRDPSKNPDFEYPGFPPQSVKLMAVYKFDNGFGFSGGPIWSDEFWLSFDQTILLPNSTVWNFNLFYQQESFEIFLAAENVFEERYFYGSEPVFGANTLVTQAPGLEAKLTVTWKF